MAATSEARMAGFWRLACAAVSTPRAASTWRRLAFTIARWLSSVVCAFLASWADTAPVWSSLVNASRSHLACS